MAVPRSVTARVEWLCDLTLLTCDHENNSAGFEVALPTDCLNATASKPMAIALPMPTIEKAIVVFRVT